MLVRAIISALFLCIPCLGKNLSQAQKAGVGALVGAACYGTYRLYHADKQALKKKLKEKVKKYQILERSIGAAGAGALGFYCSWLLKMDRNITAQQARHTGILLGVVAYCGFEVALARDRQAQAVEEIGERVQSNTKFEDIVGGVPEPVSLLVEQINRSAEAQRQGLDPIKGILLYGEPGTGKTYIARALAGQLGNVPFISVKSADVLSLWHGQTEKNIRDLFKQARKAAAQHANNLAVLFIDEIDAIGKKRPSQASDTGNGGSFSHVQALLTELDGLDAHQEGRVIVIGATNLRDSLDPALIRSGRFDYHLQIPLPDHAKRKDLLTYYSNKLLKTLQATKEEREALFTTIAHWTQGKNAADIAEIIKRTQREAFNKQAAHTTCADIEKAALDVIGHTKEFLVAQIKRREKLNRKIEQEIAQEERNAPCMCGKKTYVQGVAQDKKCEKHTAPHNYTNLAGKSNLVPNNGLRTRPVREHKEREHKE